MLSIMEDMHEMPHVIHLNKPATRQSKVENCCKAEPFTLVAQYFFRLI